MNAKQDFRDIVAALKEEGFSNKTYAFVKRAPNDLFFYGVSLATRRAPSPQESFLDVYSVVIWEELERFVQLAYELNYKLGQTATWTSYCNAGSLTFLGGTDEAKRTVRKKAAADIIFSEAIPLAEAWCSAEKLLEYRCTQRGLRVSDGAGCVVATAILKGEAAAKETLEKIAQDTEIEFERTKLLNFGKKFFEIYKP